MEENVKGSSLSTKDKLKAIRNLRLFYSTDEEFINATEKQIRSNGFNKLPEEKQEDLYRRFSICFLKFYITFTKALPISIDILKNVNLDTLLQLYKSTSNFYKENKDKIVVFKDSDPKIRYAFLDCLLENTTINNSTISKDFLSLHKKWIENEECSPAILLLLILDLIPNDFNKKNKPENDINDINTNFQIIINEIVNYLYHTLTIEIGSKNKITSFTIKKVLSIAKKKLIKNIDTKQINIIKLCACTIIIFNICSLLKSKGLIALGNALKDSKEDCFPKIKLDGLWEVIKGNGQEFYELQRINTTDILLKHYTFKRDYTNKDREYKLLLQHYISNNKYKYCLIKEAEKEVDLPESFNFGSFQIEIDKANNEYLLIFENEFLLGETGFTLKQSQASTSRYQPYLNEYNKGIAPPHKLKCLYLEEYIIFKFSDKEFYQLNRRINNEDMSNIITLNLDNPILYYERKIKGVIKQFLILKEEYFDFETLLEQSYLKKIEDQKKKEACQTLLDDSFVL